MISLKRNIKTFNEGDEIQARITDVKVNNANLMLELTPLNNGESLNFKIYHTFGAYQDRGRWFFEQFLDCIHAPEEDVSEKWFLNKSVRFICKYNVWEGKTYLAVDKFLATQFVKPVDKSLEKDVEVEFMKPATNIMEHNVQEKPRLKKSIAKKQYPSVDVSDEASVEDTH